MNLTEADVQKIINSVISNIEKKLSDVSPSAVAPSAPQVEAVKQVETTGAYSLAGDHGVFDRVEDAVKAAQVAQAQYIQDCKVEDREAIISAIRQATLANKEELGQLIWKETKLGKLEHKLAKLELTATKTPGTEDLKTLAFSGDSGLTIVEQGPFGVIGAVTPVTNPAETIINNSIGMLASGNAVVFNVHPSSKHCSAYAVKMINKAIVSAGGPANLVTMVKEPTKDSLDQIVAAPEIKLLVGTGGPGLVKALLSSGKKAVGAGAGNPPVVVDETADIENAAKEIIKGASFDNNILCIAEKEVFVVDSVADDLIYHMMNNGAYRLDQQELDKVMNFSLEANEKEIARGCSLDTKRVYHTVKDWIGKDASAFLDKLGVNPGRPIDLLICEVDFNHPFVQLEQMMPVLPIVRAKNLDEAIEMAVQAEHGNRHTAMMHSHNVNNLTRFARAIGTTIFVKNASSLAGVGFGGEGHTTMTIAGPTGEGITSARTFTRQRRCVLAEGAFRIV
jgi:acyl-CoA reductase-like NAD-dependent aldehyde dehydrogenase